ncbi:MAG: aldehyde dehydrogenase family protein, partial [Phycisphaerales bacterium]|nr:aldehyde dehydrogenase family protein [Phycisphaerales bacterium]
PGVVNVIQGGADVASALVTHDDVDGILFTGSWPVGRRILESNLDRPGRLVALEMGGNNAALVMPDANLEQAAIECVRCAFITTGQRCTCTRRVIVHRDVAERFIRAVCTAASMLVVGEPRAAHPVFMGPMITEDARDAVLVFQRSIASAGAEILVEAVVPDLPGSYITPGVARVERFVPETGDAPGCDVEVFGPYLRIAVTDDFDDGLAQVNATRFGLAASLFSTDATCIERFRRLARAGCVNVNAGTAGASSKLPFGGLGISGNHRPAGAFSLDYCAYPVAGMFEDGDSSSMATGMTFDPEWLT